MIEWKLSGWLAGELAGRTCPDLKSSDRAVSQAECDWESKEVIKLG